MIKKLQDNLTSVAAIIGVVVAIGGGFTVYGQIQEKLNNLEDINLDPIVKEIAQQNVKFEKQVAESNQRIKVLEVEVKLLKNTIEEIKAKSSNPLAN